MLRERPGDDVQVRYPAARCVGQVRVEVSAHDSVMWRR
jgi:hypothetical protein